LLSFQVDSYSYLRTGVAVTRKVEPDSFGNKFFDLKGLSFQKNLLVGLADTKGSDFARIIVSDPGEKTYIPAFISDWNVENGRLIMKDIAFSTDNNRIAAHGWINLKTDSLNLTIAALDKNGCSIISQDLYGKFDNPEMSDVKVVKSVLAPVTNLVGGALGIDCKVFYDGKIKHPLRKREKQQGNK